ncbi:MAG: aminotransferase class V-fold PLP-dependent enzyme [Chloracidobacterium sp.]|nr:aminotransferase class V-fold PLP-dependent enzyme [Chloracidobacterium sp.]
MFTRRSFIKGAAALGAVTVSFNEEGMGRALDAVRFVSDRRADGVAGDEDFWFQVQQAFTVDRTLIYFNNGNVCPSPRVAQDAMRRYLEFTNNAPQYTMRRILEPQIESVRRRLALAFGCDTEEIAVTRGASESMEICQFGLDLKPGDEILTTNQDHPRMLAAWDQRERRDGIVVKKISVPLLLKSRDEIAGIFERNITPRTRVILFCHITNLSGQIYPVKLICQLARSRGLIAIVDGAQAFAHFPFKLADLDCDYYGVSLHKYLMAPIGTGFLYVRRAKIPALWPLMASVDKGAADIRKFEEVGTRPAANPLAINEALTFHEGVGPERKAARLRYLFHRWAKRLDGQKGVRILTNFDPNQSCGLALVDIEGVDPDKLCDYLFDKYRIITNSVKHPEFQGLRVTPNIYSTLREVDIFAEAMERVIQKGLPS